MQELQLEAMEPQVYEKLIDRLGLALDVARTAVRLRDEKPAELELRGLSPAEYALIHAYLSASGGESHASLAAPLPREQDAAGKVVWLSEQPRKPRASVPLKAHFKR